MSLTADEKQMLRQVLERKERASRGWAHQRKVMFLCGWVLIGASILTGVILFSHVMQINKSITTDKPHPVDMGGLQSVLMELRIEGAFVMLGAVLALTGVALVVAAGTRWRRHIEEHALVRLIEEQWGDQINTDTPPA